MADEDNEYRPPTMLWPEVAKISVGFTTEDNLAVKVQATKGIDLMPSLEDRFAKAAAAFMKEFSEGNSLLAVGADHGYNETLERASDELAATHNVPFIDNRKVS